MLRTMLLVIRSHLLGFIVLIKFTIPD